MRVNIIIDSQTTNCSIILCVKFVAVMLFVIFEFFVEMYFFFF